MSHSEESLPSICTIVCHPSQNPYPFIQKVYPGKKTYDLIYWEPDMVNFLKNKAILWSKQRNTKEYVLVVHVADKISTPMMSLLIGIIDQGFSRPIVLIVQSTHRIPYSLIRKSHIVCNDDEPKLAKGWNSLIPGQDEHDKWEDILRT